MAKKNKENTENENQDKRSKRNGGKMSRSSFSKFCAFWGITLAALLFAVNALLQLLHEAFNVNPNGFGEAMSIIDFISKLALLFAVGVPAYGYVSNKKFVWKIIYIAAIVFYACFCIYRLF